MKLDFSIPAEHKPLVLPLIVLLVVVILSTTLTRSMVTKLLDARTAINEANEKNIMLKNKKEVLSSLKQNELVSNVNASVLAIPDEDPTLFGSSSIRDLALKENIQVKELESASGNTNQSKLKTVSLTFDLQGPLPNILSFLRRLQKSAPLIQISDIRMDGSNDNVSLKLGLSAFWSKLPDKLPPADQSFENITNAEKEVLKQLSQLEKKSSEALTPLSPEGRENPFTQ
ncbi:MAG: hypothetical protein HYU80_03415 [Candidatus Blackburnbacteria bacterium]|nr:hypothetical protein [Candidatus Blackburnbacteria bacterium]